MVSGHSNPLPEPAPALARFYRTKEDGIEAEGFMGMERNERLSPLPDWFMAEIRESLVSEVLTNYPMQERLHHQLADHLRLSADNILLTPGSDSAIKAIYQAYVRPGDKVVMLDPSYAMYPVYAQMHQAEAVQVPYEMDLTLDVERILSSISPGVRLVMLANPNQPTATLLDEDLLSEIIQRASDIGALVAMDEAYYPFSRWTAIPWLDSHPNLIVLRTFSKAAGLAGLRVGFAASHSDVIGNLFKVRTANDINSFALLCVSKILENYQVVEDYVAEVAEGGRILADAARNMGLTPLPTSTNFMSIRVGGKRQSGQLISAMRDRGYLVKGQFSSPCIEDCIRVTLGPPSLMESFVSHLADAVLEVAAENA